MAIKKAPKARRGKAAVQELLERAVAELERTRAELAAYQRTERSAQLETEARAPLSERRMLFVAYLDHAAYQAALGDAIAGREVSGRHRDEAEKHAELFGEAVADLRIDGAAHFRRTVEHLAEVSDEDARALVSAWRRGRLPRGPARHARAEPTVWDLLATKLDAHGFGAVTAATLKSAWARWNATTMAAEKPAQTAHGHTLH